LSQCNPTGCSSNTVTGYCQVVNHYIHEMKNLLLILLAITSVSCDSQEKKTKKASEKYIMTHHKNGKTVIDTVDIQDTVLKIELPDPNYIPRQPQNDTVFNTKGNPTSVKLEDDIFGASFQRFEYDNSHRLIRITGYDNQNNIKPYDKDIAIKIKEYDQNGNLIEIRHLGVDGKFISSEFEDTPIIRFVYNTKDQVIEEWYLNEDEDLRTEFAIVKFEYSLQGERKTKGWYNEKGDAK